MSKTLRTFLIALAAVCFAIALYAPVSRFFENKSLDDGMDELRQMKQRAAEDAQIADLGIDGPDGAETGSLPLPSAGAPSVGMLETDQGLYSDGRAAAPSAEGKTAPPEAASPDAAADAGELPTAPDAEKTRESDGIQTSVGFASPMPITDQSLVSVAPFAAETAPAEAIGQQIAPAGTPAPAQLPASPGEIAQVGTMPPAGAQGTPRPGTPSGQAKTDQSLDKQTAPEAEAPDSIPASSADSVAKPVPTAEIRPVLPGVSAPGTPAAPGWTPLPTSAASGLTSPTPAVPASTPSPTPVPTPAPTPFVFNEANILPEYRELYAQNADLVGWLTIEGTLIDYPVLQSDDEEYYLQRDFFGKKNYNGQLILDADADPFTPSMNLVISGHNMKSGKMFGNLQAYASGGYARKHPIIAFDTLFRKGEYKVVAAFYTWDYAVRPDGFQYNVNIEYRRQMTAFLQKLDAIKLYDTGVSVEFGDELIMLSTCSYQTGDGRFVVVARRLRAGEER